MFFRVYNINSVYHICIQKSRRFAEKWAYPTRFFRFWAAPACTCLS